MGYTSKDNNFSKRRNKLKVNKIKLNGGLFKQIKEKFTLKFELIRK